MGKLGGLLAILGVIAAPITSGDTALRTARLITADFLKFKQNTIVRRLIISIPIFIASYLIMQINYQVLWRYFGWCYQALSVFTLWAITMYLARKKKMYIITMIPALFMTMVCVTYILFAPEGLSFDNALADYLVAKYPNLEGFSLDYWLSLGIATLVSLSFVGLFYKNISKKEY